MASARGSSGTALRGRPVTRVGGRLSRAASRHGINQGLLFVLPGLVIYLLFAAWPIFSIFELGFYDWDGITPDAREWVGLENYVKLVTDDFAFKHSIRNNLLWAVLTISIQLVFGFLLAYLLNQRLRLRNFYRTAIFLPTTTAGIVVGFTWLFIYDPKIGILNTTLRSIGLDSLAKVWLNDPTLTIYAVIGVAIWHALGVWMVIFLAALQTVPQELYDCAAIDGATGLRKMIHIAIPLTAATSKSLVILGMIGAIQQFGLVYLLSRGGPYHASEVMAFQIYRLAFITNRTGYASALSVILLLISAVVTVVQLRIYRGRLQIT
jgi:raffinose/stachyose/melibiose transport system permease protein